MAGLQRSAQTFRRSGSSGLVWDEEKPELRHSRSVGRDAAAGDVDGKKRKVSIIKDHRSNQGERTRDVAPAAEPPSPRVSGCVLCSIVRGQLRGSSAQRARPVKR